MSIDYHQDWVSIDSLHAQSASLAHAQTLIGSEYTVQCSRLSSKVRSYSAKCELHAKSSSLIFYGFILTPKLQLLRFQIFSSIIDDCTTPNAEGRIFRLSSKTDFMVLFLPKLLSMILDWLGCSEFEASKVKGNIKCQKTITISFNMIYSLTLYKKSWRNNFIFLRTPHFPLLRHNIPKIHHTVYLLLQFLSFLYFLKSHDTLCLPPKKLA